MPVIGCITSVNVNGLQEAFNKPHSYRNETDINSFKQSNIFAYLDDKRNNCKNFIKATKDILENAAYENFRDYNGTIIKYIYEWAKSRNEILIPIAIPVEADSVYVVDGELKIAEQIDESTEKETSDNRNGQTLTSAVSNIYSSVRSAISAISTGVGNALSQLKGASTSFLTGFINIFTNRYGTQLYEWFMDPNSTRLDLAILRGAITSLSTNIVRYKGIYTFTKNKLSPIIINAIDPNLKNIFVSLKKLKTVEITPETATFIDDYFTKNSDPNKTFSIEQKNILARILQLLVDVFIILGEIETLDFEVLLKPQIDQGKCEVLKDLNLKPTFDSLKECLKIKTDMEKKTYHFLVELLTVLTEAAKTPFFDGGNDNNYYSWDVKYNMFVKNDSFQGAQPITQQESNKKFNLIALVYVLLNDIVDKLEQQSFPPPPSGGNHGGKANKKTLKQNMHRYSIRLRRNLKTTLRRRKRQNVQKFAGGAVVSGAGKSPLLHKFAGAPSRRKALKKR